MYYTFNADMTALPCPAHIWALYHFTGAHTSSLLECGHARRSRIASLPSRVRRLQLAGLGVLRRLPCDHGTLCGVVYVTADEAPFVEVKVAWPERTYASAADAP